MSPGPVVPCYLMTTEQVEEAPAAELPRELEIPFIFQEEDGGEVRRTMWVRVPRPEQILVWQRTVDKLTDAPATASWTGSEVMAALERLRKIVDSLLVNRADVAWIDDQFLIGRLTFATLSPFITTTVEAFQQLAAENGNREERRAAAKTTKKATRKKATR